MALYASTTQVPVERSRNEIEACLQRHGASSFGYMSDEVRHVLMFKVKNRAIRIVLPKPKKDMPEDKQAQDDRRRWRAMLLIIKAKLEAIASGIATFEDEFLPYTVMANGMTVGEWAAPQLDQLVAAKGPLLLGASS